MKREVHHAPVSSSEAIVKVSIGTFIRSSFEARFGSDVARVFREACVHYAKRLRSGRKPIGMPSIYRRPRAADGIIPIEFTLDDRITKQLEWEARRQHVSLDEFLVHAALVYLADLDSALSLWPPPLLTP